MVPFWGKVVTIANPTQELSGPVRPGRQVGVGGEKVVWMTNPPPDRLKWDTPDWTTRLQFDPGAGIWPHCHLSALIKDFNWNPRQESKFFEHIRGEMDVYVRDRNGEKIWLTHTMNAKNRFVFVPPGWDYGVCTSSMDDPAECVAYGSPSHFRHHDEGGNSFRVPNAELPPIFLHRIKLGLVAPLSVAPGWEEDAQSMASASGALR